MKLRRIVAALHPRSPLGSRIEALAEHARAEHAELLGLFIEDIELIRFAGMPFACEIGSASGRKRSVDLASMERYLTMRADELKQALGAVAERASVAWSFRSVRGDVLEELVAAGTEQEGPALLLPPGARIDIAPLVVVQSELKGVDLRVRANAIQPILLLPR